MTNTDDVLKLSKKHEGHIREHSPTTADFIKRMADEIELLRNQKDRVVHRRNCLEGDLDAAKAVITKMAEGMGKDDADCFPCGFEDFAYWATKLGPIIDAAQDLKRLGGSSVDYQNITVNAQAYEALGEALAELTE